MKKLLLLAIMIGLLTSGCASGWVSSIAMVTKVKYDGRPVDQVEVFYQEPQRPFEVIAFVNTENKTSIEGVVQKCKELSALIGADALIMTFATNQTFERTARGSGRAIRWK